jgi:signal transduction histidine kinase
MLPPLCIGRKIGIFVGVLLAWTGATQGEILWSRPEATLVHESLPEEILPLGKVKPKDSSSFDTMYFKFEVDPLSDGFTEPAGRYLAGLMFFLDGREHLGIGNAWNARGYSAFNTAEKGPGNDGAAEFDLLSSDPEKSKDFEYVRRGTSRTIVFKVQYVPGEPAQITAWLDPDLSLGSTEASQSPKIETRFRADATFDQIRLRHRGGGDGWRFSDLAIATRFEDLLRPRFWQRWWFLGLMAGVVLVSVALTVQMLERRRAQRRIQWLERERAVAVERARIARDIHDELGAELAQIGLLADIGGGGAESVGERDRNFNRIARRARSVVASLDEIVWAVNPRNDNLARLADYLCRIADECFEETSIRCRKEVPTGLPEFPVGSETRHDLTLAVKEAFTNLLKHSGASEAWLKLVWNEPDLTICVEDNGCGFDSSTARRGNGLENQRTRLDRNGGTVELESAPGRGTRLIIRIRLRPVE